ncbi:MAG: NOP5/NOP56 family protein [Nitrososphaeraceae archaeon]
MTEKCSLILFELGIAIFDDKKDLVFSKQFEDPVSSYILISNGDYSALIELSEKLRSYKSVLCNDLGLVSFFRNNGINIYLFSEDYIKEIIKSKLEYIVKANFTKTERESFFKLREFAINLSNFRIGQVSEQLDLHISQSINSLDELDKIINVIGSRLREWYGLHFPELDNLIQNIVTYAEIVKVAGNRENITLDILINLGIDNNRSQIIAETAQRSKGGRILPENLSIVKKLAEEILLQTELRRILANHIDISMEKIAPNIKELLTSTVGARLIAKSGSLNKLSLLPASTIQILGAEKALFRSLKTGARPPKHGLLFQHPVLHSAPKWQRGKIARVIASKVAIASRIDLYRKGEKDPKLIDELNNRISEIQIKYKEPKFDSEDPIKHYSKDKKIYRKRKVKNNKKKKFRKKYF